MTSQIESPDVSAPRARSEAPPPRTPPVQVWAFVGVLLVGFEIYVWTKWVTGPYFTPVPSGPSDPPRWMKAVCVIFQVAGPVGIVVLFWFVLVRPWMRRRRVTFDGLLISGLFFVSCQDPLSSYFENWYTYNSYMLNWGAWNKSFPGWISFERPGQMECEPILFTIPAYIYYLYGLSVIGCVVMRRMRSALPRSGAIGQTLACWVTLGCCAVVVEGLIWFPLGILTYPGGVGPKLFADTYHTFPLHEGLFIGAIGTGLALLRFHVDEHGRTVAERGIDRMRLGAGKEAVVRFFAVAGIANVLFFGLYNVPTGITVAHAAAWPRDTQQQRSYFTKHLCGAGTDRPCPDPALPLSRSDGIYIDSGGGVVVPDGRRPPPPVPFAR